MSHISYSELKIWAECPFKHKLIYIDKIKKFQGNEYTAFGSALHSLCENAVLGKLPEEDYDDFFDIEFLRQLESIDGEIKFRKDLVTDMRDQARIISPHILPALDQNFEDYEVFSVEERLYEDIPFFDLKPYKFKGFIT